MSVYIYNIIYVCSLPPLHCRAPSQASRIAPHGHRLRAVPPALLAQMVRAPKAPLRGGQWPLRCEHSSTRPEQCGGPLCRLQLAGVSRVYSDCVSVDKLTHGVEFVSRIFCIYAYIKYMYVYIRRERQRERKTLCLKIHIMK